MQDPPILRDARPDELASVAALLASAYAEHRAHFPAALWRTYRAELAAVADQLGSGDTIVALRRGTLVGTVTFYADASRDGHGWPPDVASLRLLGVDPDARGTGVGRALVAECVERAARGGASKLGLHTAPFMEAANRLYAERGFVRAPQHDFDAAVYYADAADAATGQLAGEAFLLPVVARKATG